MTSSVTLEPATKSTSDLVASLMQLYLHDLSEFTEADISDTGTFDYPYLDLYWVESERHPFLIGMGTEVAGFAPVRELASHSYELAEFFVLRRFRGRKIGTQAACTLFRRFAGTWHVAQEVSNTPAQEFWREVIGNFTDANFIEEQSQQPYGIRQVFSSSSKERSPAFGQARAAFRKERILKWALESLPQVKLALDSAISSAN